MPLKAVLFDFNGVILDDEPIHEQLIQETILTENLRFADDDFQRFCLGRSDRACLQDLFNSRGRVLSENTLNKLLAYKSAAYLDRIQSIDPLPLFDGLESLIQAFQAHQLKLGIVSGARRAEIERVLEKANLRSAFETIVAAEDISTSKPSPQGYLQAIAQLNIQFTNLNLQPADCLAIEDSFPGLEAAHNAEIPVVGVAHTYPFHMMQRRANWAVDSFAQLEVERLIRVYAGTELSSMPPEEPDPMPQHG
ncbi:MAG: HAD family phosphatase [Acaryochloridaceae cyanobacterium RU_4_10]|nr:HAD family phosphatase [Acaryochloridaceae cyanobacterium RU_4_10]